MYFRFVDDVMFFSKGACRRQSISIFPYADAHTLTADSPPPASRHVRRVQLSSIPALVRLCDCISLYRINIASNQFEFRRNIWHQKIESRVSCGVVSVILRSAILTQYRRVTDRERFFSQKQANPERA